MLEGVICRQRFSSQKNTCSANDHVLFRDRDAIYRYYIMKLLKQVAMRIWIFREQENILLVFMSLNPLPISFSITKPLYAFPSGQYLKFLKLVSPNRCLDVLPPIPTGHICLYYISENPRLYVLDKFWPTARPE